MQQCQKRVLCIGTLDANKQPHLFVQLAKKAHKQFGEKVSFVWLGDGSLWSECKIAATELPNLHFVGSVTNPDDYYASSHIYLQPSITESQGIAILGAMYHALPCIVTNQGGPKEMVQHGTNELLLQDELCAQMGLAGKHICMQNYLIDQWIHRMHTLLRTQKLGS
jgi:glycosyltransferase involved in cell wall biosynthesis